MPEAKPFAEKALALEFLRVVEAAAIAAARTMGKGDPTLSDGVAVEAMRVVLDTIPIRGTVVIGEGERDEAPMLYIGERVGSGYSHSGDAGEYPEVDIAVDPLEGTTLCATGAPNAIAVLAAAEKGGWLFAPDTYMEKIIVGPECDGQLDLDAPVADNLNAMARALDRRIEDLVVVVLDRPRHEQLIADIRRAGARIKLIGDGDLSAGISAAIAGTNVHAVMGIGGAPEGVLTAAALRWVNGHMLARLKPRHERDVERMERMGIGDVRRIYTENDLAPGRNLVFAACGVTSGALLDGVRFWGGGKRTHSLVMTYQWRHIRFIDTVHLDGDPDTRVRL